MKNRIAYFHYYFKYHKRQCISAWINLALLLIMLCTDLPAALQPIIHDSRGLQIANIAAFLFILFNLVWSIIDGFLLELIELHRINVRIHPSIDYIEKLHPGNGEFREKAAANHAFYKPALNALLIQKTDLSYTEDKEATKTISIFIRNYSEILFKFLRQKYRDTQARKKMFFNEQKLCLTYDPDDNLNFSTPFTVHRGSYYDTFLTNICSTKKLMSSDTNKLLYDGWNHFPKAHDELLPLELSRMNNEIGISTLAFTDDHHVVLWESNDETQTESGLLVPSGSGSADWKDRKHGSTFHDIIAYSMERELIEENTLAPYIRTHGKSTDTRLIGYWRWLEKGGKPEFCGITRLHCRIGDVHVNHKELTERRDGKHYKITSPNIAGIQQFIKETRQSPNICLPLYMNLLFLQDYILGTDLPEEKRELSCKERLDFLFGDNRS